MTYVPVSHRAHCSGCGAALDLVENETLLTCPFCGTCNRIIRQLRRAQPLFSWEIEQPKKPSEPSPNVEQWGFEELLATLNSQERPELNEQILSTIDSWRQVRESNLRWIPALMTSLKHLPQEIDRKAAGLIGKFLCSDDMKLRQKVLEMGHQFAFHETGTPGLLFSLSLADAASVRLLIDVAIKASAAGLEAYAQEALYGIQTAIGRERQDRTVAMQILLHQLFDFDEFITKWALKYIRNHFDIGYRDILGEVLEAVEESIPDRPDLTEGLLSALQRCGRPKNTECLQLRLSAYAWLEHPRAKKAALELIVPTYPLEDVDIETVLEALRPEIHNTEVARTISKFAWDRKPIHPGFLSLAEDPSLLPTPLAQAISSILRDQARE